MLAVRPRLRPRYAPAMPQIHLHAEPGDYAPLVLLPGDPNRARASPSGSTAASRTARMVNEHRGLHGYTGTYQGQPVSVQTTGMGTPEPSRSWSRSCCAWAHSSLIRVGTAGGIGPGIRTGDLVIAHCRRPVDGATRTYLHGDPYAPAADFALTRALSTRPRRRGIPAWVGPVASVDVFYNPDADYATKWRDRGVLALRDGGLGALLPRGAAPACQAACMLTVSDVMSEEVTSEETLPVSAGSCRGCRQDDRGDADGRPDGRAPAAPSTLTAWTDLAVPRRGGARIEGRRSIGAHHGEAR